MLTGFLTPMALLSSWESVHKRDRRRSAIFILLLESAMIGVFVSLDLFLFYVFWDAMLVPMYFLIGIWGYDRRIYAADQVHALHDGRQRADAAGDPRRWRYCTASRPAAYSFDLLQALRAVDFAPSTQFWLFLAFALAFAIKVPAVSVPHLAARRARRGADGRLGDSGRRAAEDGDVRPRCGSRFRCSRRRRVYFAPLLATLAVVGIIYGALVAMVQPDMKKLVAYSSVSHLGFVVLGICGHEHAGRAGRRLPDARTTASAPARSS